MGADLRVWCSQCGVPASVLVSDCTYGQSPNPRRVAAAPSRNSVTVEHRAGHDGFDEFFDHTRKKFRCRRRCQQNIAPGPTLNRNFRNGSDELDKPSESEVT